MKKRKYSIVLALIASALMLENCGPIIISSRPETPPPTWFYPNRVETVRYVYFPEYMIYYDLSLRNYIYLNNNVWIRVNVLPQPYSSINLNRSRFVRVKTYRGDNITRYHRENITTRGRTNSSSTRSRSTSSTRSRRN